MADITRDQFDEDKAVSKKIFQTGIFLADADLNEFQDVFNNNDRRMLSAMVKGEDKHFGEGFQVMGTASSLQVTIKAGFMAAHIDTDLALMLRLADDFVLTGFNAWPAPNGGRTDYVYLDIEEAEIGPNDDPNIVNPTIGDITCFDNRIVYSFEISQGALPGTPPAGHTYIVLCSIYKITGSTINDYDVTNLIPDYYQTILPEIGANNIVYNGEFDMWSNGAASSPDGWVSADMSGTIREATTVRFNKFAAKCQLNIGFLNPSFEHSVSDYEYYQGKTVKIIAYVRLVSSGTGRTARLYLDDGTGNKIGQAEAIYDYQWTKIEMETTVNASATKLEIGIQFFGNDTEDILVDGVGMWVGENPRDFEPDQESKIKQAQKTALGFSAKGTLTGSLYLYHHSVNDDGFPLPFPCRVTAIYAFVGTAPTGGDITFEVRKSGIGSGLIATITDGTQNGSDIGSIEFETTNRISVYGAFGGYAAQNAQVSLLIEPLAGEL